MELKIGTIIESPKNRFIIKSLLGHGTFGITYSVEVLMGRHKGRIFALKEFFINGISSREESGNVSSCSDTILIEQCKDEFVEEAKNLIILNHPNIVKAHEIFEANGTVYYTMDYIEGENLNSYLKHIKLTLDEAIKIITKIAYGLSYMHESRHMLHLDLKPANIMRRSSDGQIILIDFGLSRYFTDNDKPETESSIGLGTKGYAPIEQSEFKTRTKDFKATIDVYALGATFYKLITKETPIPSNELIKNPGWISQNLQFFNLEENIIRVIEKAMHPIPDKRYQSVMDFIYDINIKERKQRKKGCLLSFIMLIVVTIIFFISLDIMQDGRLGKIIYYENLNDYAFEMFLYDGGNNAGQSVSCKIFSNGTGVGLYKSWNDNNGKNKTDILKLNYGLENENTIIFNAFGEYNFFVYYNVSVILDTINNQIIIKDDYPFPNSINEKSINWNEVKKILERN